MADLTRAIGVYAHSDPTQLFLLIIAGRCVANRLVVVSTETESNVEGFTKLLISQTLKVVITRSWEFWACQLVMTLTLANCPLLDLREARPIDHFSRRIIKGLIPLIVNQISILPRSDSMSWSTTCVAQLLIRVLVWLGRHLKKIDRNIWTHWCIVLFNAFWLMEPVKRRGGTSAWRCTFSNYSQNFILRTFI